MAAGLKGFQERLAQENEQILSEMQSRVALEERTFLARELHDSISQILFSMTLQTRAAELTLQKEGLDAHGPLAHHLTRMRELTNGALAEMRALIFELRPGALREEGLVAALRKQAAGIAARDEFAVEVEAPEDLIDFDPITEEQLYRIGQEALHNVMKHAGAGRVRIRLLRPREGAAPAAPPGEFVLEISDDGCGFDPAIRRPGHMGLQTMSQRARRIGGRLEVESAPGEGTTVRVRVVPRRNPAEDPDRRAAATAPTD
jgi:signal transduction histidine kinase